MSVLTSHSASVLQSSPPSPWLSRVLYPLGRHLLLPNHFRQIAVRGQENLPRTGPVILAPNHSSRWDALIVPYVAGWDITGRHLRFMVSMDEITGVQGWFMRRMGGFAIDTAKPGITSLRHGVELLQQGEILVIFPEGNIFRDRQINPLKPGLARLALQAGAEVQVVPLAIHYSDPVPHWGTQVSVTIGSALPVKDYLNGSPKAKALQLTQELQCRMQQLYAEASSVLVAADPVEQSLRMVE
ncbi:1-acyl-sn-glycerol-3-phosphate acyltransferase [Leptolyngbya sp. FACHB-261]|uniref:lysophospholipid acyltransferase family protein n=1 Tax=Leptolyngbya sp. FACHB-261 TaxID=2692806 RepID=UPI001682C308|nr:lysophospholipid acyltransferase family protein [Leptolyngbya sp. FACHB-261]MBD2102074.1 1-acyl-sn-glycerol-3-phosphate acyltransferase [Leptolyngbya sp. FACHB-261]